MKHLKKIQSVSEITPTDYMVVYSTEEKVYLKGSQPIPPTPSYEMVDLGLPSGLKWASCNIGATKPEEYGLYFQYGDTVGYEGDEAKAHSTWETCPFNNGSSSLDSTYFNSVKDSVCPNGVLALEYDAAHVHMGEGWRMPNADEIREIESEDNTTIVFVENYNNSGVNGALITSNVNMNYIFIPASGNFYNNNLYGDGSFSELWTSSNYKTNAAYHLQISNTGFVGMDTNLRIYGIPIRGIHA